MFVLLNDDGYVESYAIVGNLVGGIEVSDPEDIEHFEEHYESYGFSEGKIHFDDVWEKELNKAKRQRISGNEEKRSAFLLSTEVCFGMKHCR